MASRSERPWSARMTGCVLGVIGLVALAGHAAWLGRVDSTLAERYARQLESLPALDAKLTAETLKTRSGLVPHYDGLARIERIIDAAHRSLQRAPSFLSRAERAQLTLRLHTVERNAAATSTLVEHFKSENAVLRNSLLFLRTAASALDAYPGATPAQRAFREEANALVRDVLLLRLSQDRSVLERVSQSLRELGRYVAEMELTRRSDLELILAHARAVYEHAPSVDRLLRRIVDRPEPARDLSVMYARYHRAALQRASLRTAAFLIVLLLGGALAAGAVITRLRSTASALRSAGVQLQEALAALELEQEKQRELSELKTRFVSMTSHEFRTPLSTIMSSSEMLCAYDARWTLEKKAQHFGRIQVAVINMTRMLDAILLIGQSDAGKLEFRPAVLHLGRFCNETAETATKALADGHELTVDATLDGELVIADEALLRQVVDNLLNNAIKYSPRGGLIEFGVKRDGEDVVFDVRDHGIGIPLCDQPRLFETFHRGENVGSVAGSGLGLSIVKRAVDLHGGSVTVESELGVGTRFVVRMRCPRSAA